MLWARVENSPASIGIESEISVKVVAFCEKKQSLNLLNDCFATINIMLL